MSIDIFIRTYPKDFTLLYYCLISIKKYIKGYRNIIICIREKDYNNLIHNIDLNGIKVVKEHDFANNIDYIGQQISKLQADIWSDADYFCYVDSDCIFTRESHLNEYYFKNNKIIILKDEWCNVGDAKCWLPGLKNLDLLTDYEFMRRLPQIYPSSILPKIRELIVQKTCKDFINGCIYIHQKFKFSEFNIMGSYLFLYESEKCNFINSKDYKEENIIKQFWSHSDLKTIIPEIKRILNS